MVEAYNSLKIEKKFGKINDRTEYINQLKELDMILINKNKEMKTSKKVIKKEKRKINLRSY